MIIQIIKPKSNKLSVDKIPHRKTPSTMSNTAGFLKSCKETCAYFSYLVSFPQHNLELQFQTHPFIMKTLFLLPFLKQISCQNQESIDDGEILFINPFKDGIVGSNILTNSDQRELIQYLQDDLLLICERPDLEYVKNQCMELRSIIGSVGSNWFGNGVSNSMLDYLNSKQMKGMGNTMLSDISAISWLQKRFSP